MIMRLVSENLILTMKQVTDNARIVMMRTALLLIGTVG